MRMRMISRIVSTLSPNGDIAKRSWLCFCSLEAIRTHSLATGSSGKKAESIARMSPNKHSGNSIKDKGSPRGRDTPGRVRHLPAILSMPVATGRWEGSCRCGNPSDVLKYLEDFTLDFAGSRDHSGFVPSEAL